MEIKTASHKNARLSRSTRLTLLPLSFILLFSLSGLFVKSLVAQPILKNIKQDWVFRLRSQNLWFNATVPGTLHTDLMQNGLLVNPYYRSNEKEVQMLEDQGVEYLGKFDAGIEIFNSSHVELIFEGIDTYAAVWMNNKKLFDADNMFRTYRLDVKPLLIQGRNELDILIEPAVPKGKAKVADASIILPGDEKVYTRKAAYQYGWDWGPRLVTAGLWRPVKLLAWSDAIIRDAFVGQKDCNEKEAKLVLKTGIECDKPGKYRLILTDRINGSTYFSDKISLDKGYQSFENEFIIKNPKLWWCNGLGEAFLYRFKVELIANSVMVDFKDLQVGIRTVEIVQTPDTAAWTRPITAAPGKSFYFKLNGIPVFMKGANYIPADNFMPRVDSARYAAILDQAVKSNMNMLRVWGGGNYESDVFYDLCDEKGLLVWQDFMFACAMYPGDSAFLKSVRKEATDNVIRLRQHPCIALWCGNNEIDEGWKNWGWQKQFNYTAKDSARVWHDYQAVFHQILPDVVKTYDADRFYWPSSPSIGWGRKESLQSGDSHYWGVWWGMQPFSIYEQKLGRFMSEYGFQGFPDLQTFESFTRADDRVLGSEVLKTHQKHATGFETIQTYLEREYRQPKDFANYVYVSQLLQAGGIRRAIEAHRTARPYCMGTLYWQLNDCWPSISWSGMDYQNRWKALQYAVKDAYAPVLLKGKWKDNVLDVYVDNQSLSAVQADLQIELTTFEGKLLNSMSMKKLDIPANALFQVNQAQQIPLKPADTTANVCILTLLKEGKTIAQQQLYFSRPGHLNLTAVEITTDIAATADGFRLTLNSSKLAKNVWLRLNEGDGFFEDNYFDLLAGIPVVLQCKTTMTEAEFRQNLVVRSLVDSY